MSKQACMCAFLYMWASVREIGREKRGGKQQKRLGSGGTCCLVTEILNIEYQYIPGKNIGQHKTKSLDELIQPFLYKEISQAEPDEQNNLKTNMFSCPLEVHAAHLPTPLLHFIVCSFLISRS